MSRLDDLRTDDESGGRNRRRLLLLLVVALVVVGAGAGTFAFTGPDGGTDTTTAPPVTATPAPTADVSIGFPAGATLLQTEGVVPGESDTATLVLRNTGDRTGELAIAGVTVEEAENGIVGPEGQSDDSPGAGELASALLVRLSIQYSGGDTVTVYGADEFVPLEDVTAANETIGDGLAPGADATVVLDWRVAEVAGNAIQTDSVSFAITFNLRAPTNASSA